MATYDWETQPEAAGAILAFTADSTGMRFPEALGPSRAGPGEVTQGHAERVFLPTAEEREDRRHAEALSYDASELALRNLVHGAARSAGADYRTAARTADELVKRAPAVSTISEQAMDTLTDAISEAVSLALAGTQPKPPRPHRRTRPLEPPKEVAKEKILGDKDLPTETPEVTS